MKKSKSKLMTFNELGDLVKKGLDDEEYIIKHGLGRAIERLGAELFVGQKRMSPKEIKIIKVQLKQFLANRTFNLQMEE